MRPSPRHLVRVITAGKSPSAASGKRAPQKKEKILSKSPDSAQRKEALDLGRSFIVEAPAGSGKTTLLAQRYLALLGTVKRPESIVAMTFTRKAAAELTDRVHGAIRDALDGVEMEDDYAQTVRELALRALDNSRGQEWHLANDLSRLQIQTIDSLCATLTRQMPIVSEFGGVGQVIEDARELYRLAARRTLRTLTEGDSSAKSLFRRISLHFDNDMSCVESQTARMLEHRDQWCGLAADRNRELVNDFCRLLDLAHDELLSIFRERSAVDFTEVTRAAIRALGDPEQPSELLYWLDYRIEHLLVDEFQDTSKAQYQLVEALTGQWSDGDGRTLFLVGDPMQSIYRFREAEVSLFLECRQNERLGSVRLHPLQLTANFRSTPEIVDWAQSAFAPIMNEDDPAHGAVKMREAVATRARGGTLPKIIPFIEDDGSAEAREVVEIVQGARRRGTVAILLRSRAHVSKILPALRREGIPYEAVEIDELREGQHILDLISLTRAIVHLGDRISWLACLRAPWCGLTLADLSLLAENERDKPILDLLTTPEKIFGLCPDGRLRANRVADILSAAVARIGKISLRELVEQTWLALGGPATLVEQNQLDDAEAYFGMLEARDEGGIIRDFSLMNEALATLYAKPSTAPDCVQVLTIHKAKGLEFDTVILPQLGRTTKPNERELLIWTEVRDANGPRLHLAAQPQKAADDDEYKLVSDEIKCKDRHEAKRLFYVAVTRSRNELYLLGSVKTNKARTECNRAPVTTFLGLIWDSVKPLFESERLRRAPRQTRLDYPDQPNTVLRRLPAGWRSPQLEPSIDWQPSLRRAAASQRREVTYEWVSDTARHVGVVVHELLKNAARTGSYSPTPGLEGSVRAELLQLGVPRAEVTTASLSVLNAVENTLRSERGRWILAPHAESRSEWPVDGRIDDQLISGTVDRAFRDEDGRFWIIDFKTGRHLGGDLPAFLNEEQRRHRAQLETYAVLVSRLVAGPIWLGLYFPLVESWREWQLEEAALTLTKLKRMPTKLTANVKAGGCASKLSPKILDRALKTVPRLASDKVLVGYDTADDAGVYDLTQPGGTPLAIVQTVDFFTPIVDDPYTFGAIAAANALSDIYAMGGRPITALSLVVFPAKGDISDLEAILKGGADKIHEAGCVILGGHSISDDEIKFGYSVTGTVAPDSIWTNAGARPGDVLVFTKRVGTGVISTALKKGSAEQTHIDASIAQMLTLNRAVAETLSVLKVHGCTDVTGFGLLGHAREMALASDVTLQISAAAVRFLPGAVDYSKAGAHSGGLNNNRDFVESCVAMDPGIAPEIQSLLYDPQTSGGLLIALGEEEAKKLFEAHPEAYQIGVVTNKGTKPIQVNA